MFCEFILPPGAQKAAVYFFKDKIMTLELKKTGYGAEQEFTTQSPDAEYRHLIQGLPIRDYLNQHPSLLGETKETNGEEEWATVVELQTDVYRDISSAVGEISSRLEAINAILELEGCGLQTEAVPNTQLLDPSISEHLAERFNDLINQDPGWKDVAPLTAVCAFQVTSSNFHKILKDYNPELSELEFKKLQLQCFIDILRYYQNQRDQINELNNHSERLAYVREILIKAKSGRFSEKEMSYNFQPADIPELISILMELGLKKDQESQQVSFEWKSCHHMYAKMKGKVNYSSDLLGVFAELIHLSHQDKLAYLQANSAALELIIDSLDIIAFEYRPFDTSVNQDQINSFANFIYTAEMHVICNAHSQS